jgi:hypothetical protein
MRAQGLKSRRPANSFHLHQNGIVSVTNDSPVSFFSISLGYPCVFISWNLLIHLETRKIGVDDADSFSAEIGIPDAGALGPGGI